MELEDPGHCSITLPSILAGQIEKKWLAAKAKHVRRSVLLSLSPGWLSQISLNELTGAGKIHVRIYGQKSGLRAE